MYEVCTEEATLESEAGRKRDKSGKILRWWFVELKGFPLDPSKPHKPHKQPGAAQSTIDCLVNRTIFRNVQNCQLPLWSTGSHLFGGIMERPVVPSRTEDSTVTLTRYLGGILHSWATGKLPIAIERAYVPSKKESCRIAIDHTENATVWCECKLGDIRIRPWEVDLTWRKRCIEIRIVPICIIYIYNFLLFTHHPDLGSVLLTKNRWRVGRNCSRGK